MALTFRWGRIRWRDVVSASFFAHRRNRFIAQIVVPLAIKLVDSELSAIFSASTRL